MRCESLYDLNEIVFVRDLGNASVMMLYSRIVIVDVLQVDPTCCHKDQAVTGVHGVNTSNGINGKSITLEAKIITALICRSL